ncbi:MAG: glycosyltransferase family 39 protein, partial [Planctomycetaceae bacterium]|nr:glycosyltransferase family 39 protein [Planctomycetaceae bacterium]
MSSKHAAFVFWITAVLYGVFWTVYPYLIVPNYQYDVIEMFFIGKEGVLATFKHPAINSIVLELLYHRIGLIAPYLLNQICFFTAALGVWQLSKEFLPPKEALFGALTFYGYWGYFYHSLYYNHNVVLIPVWSLAVLWAFYCIKYSRTRDWIGLGIIIGLGMYAKMTTVFLVAVILAYMLLNPSTRKHFLQRGPYLTAVVSLVLAAPMIWWVWATHFSALDFPVQHYGLEKNWSNRFYSLTHDGVLAPVLLISAFVLLCPLFRFTGKHSFPLVAVKQVRNYLLGITVLTWLVFAVPCFIGAVPKRVNDYYPLAVFAGPLFLAWFPVYQSKKRDALVWCLFALTMTGYIAGHTYRIYGDAERRVQRFQFPGQELAEKATVLWHTRYPQSLPYIVSGGDFFLAGCVAFYSSDRPSFHGDYGLPTRIVWERATDIEKIRQRPRQPLSTWSTDSNVLHSGGLVLWDEDDEYAALPKHIAEKFPSAELVPQSLVLKPLLS